MGEVRLSEERIDELITSALGTKITHTRTFVQDTHTHPTTAIILIPYPNPFRDSLRSSQGDFEVSRGNDGGG